MNDYFEPRPVEPHRALTWFRLALALMTRRLPVVLLVTASVYVAVRFLAQLPFPPPEWLLGPALLLPLAMAGLAQLFMADWWFGESPPPLRVSLPTLLHAGLVLLLLHLSVALVQWLDVGGLDAVRDSALLPVQLVLPESLSAIVLAGAEAALSTRLIEEPLALAALATALGVTECWFVPLLLRFANAPPDAAVPLARRAMERNRWVLLPVLAVVLVGARLVGEVPVLGGLYACFVAALAAVSFRDIFGQRDELEPVRELGVTA